MKKTNRDMAEHYIWKDICDGWHFVKEDAISVIAEKMPPQTAEDMHYHQRAMQFFYILSGEAVMRFLDHEETLLAGDGIEIFPNEAHQMSNISDAEVEFLVVSMPKSHGDRIIVQ